MYVMYVLFVLYIVAFFLKKIEKNKNKIRLEFGKMWSMYVYIMAAISQILA